MLILQPAGPLPVLLSFENLLPSNKEYIYFLFFCLPVLESQLY